MNPVLLFAGILTGSSLVFVAGLALGSALCNRRWAEKCARCQTLMDRCNATPHLLSALSKLPPILHSTRGPRA
jgi:hypothetical protein